MTLKAYKKLLDLHAHLHPDPKGMMARVLLNGGIWVTGDVRIDEEDVVTIYSGQPTGSPPGDTVTDLTAIVAIQLIP